MTRLIMTENRSERLPTIVIVESRVADFHLLSSLRSTSNIHVALSLSRTGKEAVLESSGVVVDLGVLELASDVGDTNGGGGLAVDRATSKTILVRCSSDRLGDRCRCQNMRNGLSQRTHEGKRGNTKSAPAKVSGYRSEKMRFWPKSGRPGTTGWVGQ